LAYVDDVGLIGNDIRTIERNADVLLNACKSSLAVNTEKSKNMEVGSYQDMMANEHITLGSISYEKVNNLKYLDFIDKLKFYS
jgi:hypothetical protein